ncbi:MAG: hypothetical protein GY754_06520 [bacterium]|nr:hypothetical protein [bacterium]
MDICSHKGIVLTAQTSEYVCSIFRKLGVDLKQPVFIPDLTQKQSHSCGNLHEIRIGDRSFYFCDVEEKIKEQDGWTGICSEFYVFKDYLHKLMKEKDMTFETFPKGTRYSINISEKGDIIVL